LKADNNSIHPSALLGNSVVVWQGTCVRERAELGSGTSIGQFAYIGPGVIIGKNCRIQNHALIYEPAVVRDNVFIGPNVTITNDLAPRAVNPDLTPKKPGDWVAAAATLESGCSIGAGAILVGPVSIGEWAMVGAGSIVTRDVAAHSLVVGAPAKHVGWVGVDGKKLSPLPDGRFRCLSTGVYFKEISEADETRRLVVDRD